MSIRSASIGTSATGCLTLALLAAASLPGTAARAQTSAPATAAPDIIVTAQRREQRLQDVGIAITALQSRALQQLNITKATDLTRAVPTLKMNAYSSSQVVFNIRGVSQNDYGDQQEPPIAVYQDDSYASSINLASFPIFDLSRAEVLRGPQGTLFGRNATGGAVQFISNQPTKYLDGYVSVTTGSYGEILTEGAVSGPITDNLQVRVSGMRDRDTGYLKNINPGAPALGANNHWAVRGIIAWQPTSRIEATLTLRYMRAPQEREAGMYSLVAACPNSQLQGEFLDASTTCPYWVGVGTPGPGTTATGLTNDAINPQRGGDPYKIYQTGPNYADRRFFGSTLRLNVDLGDFTLTSITDYQHSHKFYVESTSPDPGELFFQGSRVDQESQEFRLSTHRGAHELVVGAFGMLIDGHYVGSYGTPFIDYDPLATFSQHTRSFAFFAQDEWEVAPRVKLIGGLRYWNDRKRGAYFATEASTGVSLTFNDRDISYSSFGVPQPLNGLTVTPNDADISFSGLTARAEIDYKPSSRTLLYASFNRGSKSGGFTFPTSTPYPGGEINALNGIPYKPETLNAYEIGAKLTLPLSTTLNLAAFYYDYQHYQAFAQSGLIQTVLNLNARSKGIEADLTTQPFRGFTLRLSGGLLDTRVKDVPLPDDETIVDHHLPQAPGFSGSALVRYEFGLLGYKASIQADVLHSGRFCFTVLCAPVEREGAYNVANVRIGFGDKDDRWEIAAFVNNVNDERYRQYALDESLYDGSVLGVYAPPRTWGLTGTVHFGGKP
jgi:iron complex outermembrane receptor protein